MGDLSIWHWLIVLLVVAVLFGSGKVRHFMGDVARGVKDFKKIMHEDDKPQSSAAPQDVSMVAGIPQLTESLNKPQAGSEGQAVPSPQPRSSESSPRV